MNTNCPREAQTKLCFFAIATIYNFISLSPPLSYTTPPPPPPHGSFTLVCRGLRVSLQTILTSSPGLFLHAPPPSRKPLPQSLCFMLPCPTFFSSAFHYQCSLYERSGALHLKAFSDLSSHPTRTCLKQKENSPLLDGKSHQHCPTRQRLQARPSCLCFSYKTAGKSFNFWGPWSANSNFCQPNGWL